MAGVYSLLARVRRLEAARASSSPFGDLDELEADCRVGMAGGWLDLRDVPEVLEALGRWERDGLWAR